MSETIVLLVEDESELRSVYEAYLEETAIVRTASTGAEALEKIDDDVDVVLLDRRLPDTTGASVLESFREEGYDMPVAMVTAVEPDVDIVDMAFDEYLTKPVNREELITTVQVLRTRSTFEEQSRRYFRLATKRASLESATDAGDSEEYVQILDQMRAIRDELRETIEGVSGEYEGPLASKDMDAEEATAVLSEVVDHTLPDVLRELVEDYQDLEEARPPFMWKWVHSLAPQNSLPCVDSEYRDRVTVDKTLVILFITLLDDALEKRGDRATFRALTRIPHTLDQDETPPAEMDPVSRSDGGKYGEAVDTDYVAFARRVWSTLLERIQEAPHYDRFEPLFRYDISQAMTGVEYSDLAITRPDLSTLADLERYESHNMVMFAYADIDLMHSSTDARGDLPALREAVWTAQKMARIGNWVSTWERELREGDFSSGPVVYALEHDIVDHEELLASTDDQTLKNELIERISENSVEEEFLRRWEREHHRLQIQNEAIKTMDLESFISGTEEVLRYHLASTGLK